MDRISLAPPPGDVKPALRRLGEAFERIAVDRVDRYPLTRGHDADDAVSRRRVATTREVQRHAGDQAADRHRGLVAFRLAPRPGQRDDLALGFLGLRKRGVGYRAPGNETLADRDIEVLDGGAVEVEVLE